MAKQYMINCHQLTRREVSRVQRGPVFQRYLLTKPCRWRQTKFQMVLEFQHSDCRIWIKVGMDGTITSLQCLTEFQANVLQFLVQIPSSGILPPTSARQLMWIAFPSSPSRSFKPSSQVLQHLLLELALTQRQVCFLTRPSQFLAEYLIQSSSRDNRRNNLLPTPGSSRNVQCATAGPTPSTLS